MEKNVGNYEAVLRSVVGASALALAVSQRNPLWLAFSLLHFGTAISRYCPINAAFGINTYEGERHARPALRQVPTVH